MHLTANDLLACLESDLNASGWDGSTVTDLGRHPSQYAMSSLRNSLVKKYTGDTVSDELARLTLQGFLACNAACEQYVPVPQREQVQEWEWLLYGEVKNILYDFFHECPRLPASRPVAYPLGPPGPNDGNMYTPPFDSVYHDTPFPILSLTTVVQGLDVGPGASVGSTETDFVSKLVDGKLTYTTEALYDFYTRTIGSSPTWASCEATRSQAYGRTPVVGSRLSFVPKSSKIARTICTEPLLNMMFQKGVAAVLEKRLETFFSLRLKKHKDRSPQQEWNSHLAHLGSVTGGFATIDLSSASDTIAKSMIEDLIDPVNYYWLEKTRSPATITPDGATVQLSMISSMGNAFTFPLQTAIFAAIVHAVYRLHGLHPVGPDVRCSGNFGVFGDDIIVDTRVYEATISALKLFGFTPNVDKSFGNGGFRESCGHDYYLGHNIRGVYIQSLGDPEDFYSAYNRLMRWSLRWVPLPKTLSLLAKGAKYLPVPADSDDASGFKVPIAFAPTYSRGKEGKQYSRLVKLGLKMYKYRKVVPRTRDIRALGAAGKYPDGLLLAAVAGRLRNGRLGLRTTKLKTVLKVGVTPRWSYIPPGVEEYALEETWEVLLLETL